MRPGTIEPQLATKVNYATLKLTPTQRVILEYLRARANQLVTRDELARHVWGRPYFDCDRALLDTHMCYLRAALGDSAEHPQLLLTQPGTGYRWIGGAL